MTYFDINLVISANLGRERKSQRRRRWEDGGDGDGRRIDCGGIGRGDGDWAPLLGCTC